MLIWLKIQSLILHDNVRNDVQQTSLYCLSLSVTRYGRLPVQIIQCRVVSVVDSGLHVESTPGSVAAFLPKLHLSDHRSMCEATMLTYQVDDVIDRVMYLGKSGGVVSLRFTLFCSLCVSCFNPLTPTVAIWVQL